MQALRRFFATGGQGIALATLLLLLGLAAPSHASSAFSFTFTDGANIAYGLLSASDNGDGTFTATSGMLYVIGGADVGAYSLYPDPYAPNWILSPYGAFIIDDVLYPGQEPSLDVYGLLFTGMFMGNRMEINIWGNGPGIPYSFYDWYGRGFNVGSSSGTFTLAATSTQQVQALQWIVQALVNSGVMLPANGNSLQAKLNAALNYLAIGDTADAIGSLKAFLNQVNSLIRTGSLNPTLGQSLIDQANAMMAALGG